MSASGRQIGVDMAHNFMLMTLFSILADISDDSDEFRSSVRKSLFNLADGYQLPGIKAEIAEEAREAAKAIIDGILQNAKSSLRGQ